MISIIIPIYNTEKYLKRCLDSAINQTFCDIEIICVNDGSKDKSLDILNEYKNKDSRIKIINQQNQGVSIARNNAIKESKGEYLFFLDSDDWIESNCIDILYKNAKRADADITYCALNIYGEDEKKDWDFNRYFRKICQYNNFVESILTIGGKLYKKSFIISNNIEFPTGIKNGEDTYFNTLSLFKNATFKPVFKILYNYQHPREESASTSYINHNFYDLYVKMTNSELFKNADDEYKKLFLYEIMVSQICAYDLSGNDYEVHKKTKEMYQTILNNHPLELIKDCACFNQFRYIAKKRYKPKTLTRKIFSLTSWINFIKYSSFVKPKLRKMYLDKLNSKTCPEAIKKLLSLPKISVVIPVYNCEKYLKKCLDSVLNQTLSDIEVICVDDGSSDNSLEILKEYSNQDDRIVIVEQKHSDAGSARNKGLEFANGKYVHFLDADDWIKKDAYEKIYEYATENKA